MFSKIGGHYRILISKTTDVIYILIGTLAIMVNCALNERGQGQRQEGESGGFNNKSEKTG